MTQATSWSPAQRDTRHATLFFFSSRRRHTRFDCDWSSDVCSSDLFEGPDGIGAANQERSKTQYEDRMTQARAKILPERRARTGIVGRKKQREHENQDRKSVV